MTSTTTKEVGEPVPPGDDYVIPFRVERSGVTGRLVRFGPLVDKILCSHNYPEPVSVVLGQALVLSTMLGATLKHDSKFILQTQTDGPIRTVVVNYTAPGCLRGYAAFDAERIPDQGAGKVRHDLSHLLGRGHLAMTIAPGGDMDQYQGIVALDYMTLEDAAMDYFRQSEQLPTFVRLAVARHFAADDGGSEGGWRWRAGGLIVQKLSWEGGTPPPQQPGSEPDEEAPAWDQDEDWERARILSQSTEDHELLDPVLASDALLYRLFHEDGVRTFDAKPMSAYCGCSRGRIEGFLKQFDRGEIREMATDDGRVRTTCEFCNKDYFFTPKDLA